jgi:ABC-type dipeptide/oligopeptide/nickel transport system permease component
VLRFLLQRLVGIISVILGVTFVTFLMGLWTPGDPISALLGAHYTRSEYVRLAHQYGLDLPWYAQYGRFLLNLVTGNFGYSFQFRGETVAHVIGPSLNVSLQLGLGALIWATTLGIGLGIVAAMRRNTWIDTTIVSSTLLAYALPTFVTIPLYQLLMDAFYAHNLPTLPVVGWSGGIQFKIAPIVLLGLVSMGYYARLTRTVVLDVLEQDYVRTARSKGLPENQVIAIHAFRNAMLPIITVIGPSLAFLVTGAFITETIFTIPGIGLTSIQAVTNRDWPVLQATVVLLALVVSLANIVTDILYSAVDPRIRIES